MAEDQGKEEEKFDFTPEGEVIGYISLDQARVLAMRHARENTDFYGEVYGQQELTWEELSAEEGEDYYRVRVSYRPIRGFDGRPGVELFTIDKSGPVEIRQILQEPRLRPRFPLPGIAAGVIALVAALVGGLFAAGVFSPGVSGPDGVPTDTPSPTTANTPVPASVQTTPLPTDTTKILPADVPIATPSSRPKSTAIPTRAPTAMPAAASAPPATALPSPTTTPILTPNVVAISAGIVVPDSEILSQPWVQGTRPDIPNYEWGSGSGSQVAYFSVSSDDVTLFASDYSLSNVPNITLFKSSDGGRTWLSVVTSGERCTGPTRAQVLIFDMNDPQKILGQCSGWWQSEDGGDSWMLSDFAPPGGPIIYPDVIYAGGRFRSEDGGQTWRELITEYPISQGTPGYPSALYAIKTHTTFSIDIFLSKDGTGTWNRVETPQAKDEPYFIFTFDSSSPPNIVLGFPEEGLFRANALDPKDWELLSWPPGSTGAKEVALHPTNPDVVAFTDEDGGVFITFDGADSWVPLHQTGYQIGNVVYNGLPIFSGGRRPLVVTGGPSPTICIGSDTGPWCHSLVVTSSSAPTSTPKPVPTPNLYLTYVHPTRLWQIDYPLGWQVAQENLASVILRPPELTDQSPSLNIARFEGGAVFEFAKLDTWKVNSSLVNLSYRRIISSQIVEVGGHDAFEEISEWNDNGRYKFAVYLIEGEDTYRVEGYTNNWSEDESLFRKFLYSFCLLPDC